MKREGPGEKVEIEQIILTLGIPHPYFIDKGMEANQDIMQKKFTLIVAEDRSL